MRSGFNRHHPTRYWHRIEGGRVQCDLCPRECKLREGQRGLCFVRACRARGIKSVAVSAGYIHPEPRSEFFRHMDAANIDLKAFTERFYYRRPDPIRAELKVAPGFL